MKPIFLLCISFLMLPAFSQIYPSSHIFDDTQLLNVEVTLSPDTLNWIMQNTHSDEYHSATVRFQNSWMDTTLNHVGFRLRGNTSRDAQKKSFKISFDAFVPGRRFLDMACLNLNGEHNDPSIIRSKLCFDQMHDIGLVASRAGHARVYLNGSYYGLMMNVESIDKQFIRKNYHSAAGNLWKCLYPADLTYLSENPGDYRSVQNGGRPAYELKTNESLADFSELARFIRIINNTGISALPDSLEQVAEPYEFLQYFALNNLVGSWDEYWSLMNNYYLYADPSTGFIHLIPYDYDNTFGVDWFSVDWAKADPYVRQKVASGDRPLAERMLQVNAYRDLYTHFLDFYNIEVFSMPVWENRLQGLYNLISPAAEEDLMRTLDYGFSMDDFNNSYTSRSYNNKHVKYGIRQYTNARNGSLGSQLNYVNGEPVLYHPTISSHTPLATESVLVAASCYSHSGLNQVTIVYTPDGGGTVQSYPMTPAPVENTKLVEEADRWQGAIPSLGEGKSGSFRIELKDNQGRIVAFPRGGSWTLKSMPVYPDHILINEFMASNQNYRSDPQGQFDDWLELFNPTSVPVSLAGMHLSDSRKNLKKWSFGPAGPDIGPGEYLVVWCDADTLDSGRHANFKLNADGEFICLTDTNGSTIIDSVSFGLQRPDVSRGRFPNGSVYWGFMTPSMDSSNLETAVKKDILLAQEEGRVFPNPFRDQLNVALNHAGKGECRVRIIATDGTTVFNEKVFASDPAGFQFSIYPQIPAGIYSLVVENARFRMVRRIVCFR